MTTNPSRMSSATRKQVLSKAANVFGSQARAKAWLEQPALALDNARPVDLLKTPQGADLVMDQLIRLEYSVYS